MVGEWMRVTRQMPCPICHKDHWCMLHKDRKAAICPRVSEGCKKDLGDAGYLHSLVEEHDRFALPRFEPRVPARQTVPDVEVDWPMVIEEFKSRATPDDKLVAAGVLGVSRGALDAMGFGLTAKGAWTFPMSDWAGEPCGVRIRTRDGKKWAYPGSRNGLFIPSNNTGKDPLLICEGPTDTACAVNFGFDAIGRSSCNGCLEWCLDVSRGRNVAIFADNDGPGLDGANKLAQWIVRQSRWCKVIVSPYHKDLRDAKRDGLTAAGLRALIDNAAYFEK